MRTDKRSAQKSDKKASLRANKRGVVGYSKKSALLEEAITHMNSGKYGRSSAALKELLALDPHNTEARRLFATLHLRLGSLVTARQAFESLANEAIGRQDYWLAESLLREYLAAGPRCVPFLELLAHVQQEKGDEMAAVGELGKAIEILRDDPDRDNPQKAAQLYAKIRELAPGSPVAIELSSMFDVQTGELRNRPVPDDTSVATDEVATPVQSAPVSIEAESLSAEVMPWEVMEESISVSESSAGLPAAFAEPIESASTTDSLAKDQAASIESVPQLQDLPTPPFESAILPDESNHPSSIAIEPSVGAGETSELPEQLKTDGFLSVTPPVEPEWNQSVGEQVEQNSQVPATDATHSLSSPMPWDQIADGSVQIGEADVIPSPTVDSSLDRILSALKEDLQAPILPSSLTTDAAQGIESSRESDSSAGFSSDASTRGPVPMPWDQVADEALQIPEIEPSSEPAVSTSIDSRSTDLTQDSGYSWQPQPEETASTQPDHSAPTTSWLDGKTVGEDPSASIAGPESESPVQPSEGEARSSSFSWTSVFDTAWKIAVGTTAPDSSKPSTEAQDIPVETQELARDHGSLELENVPPTSNESVEPFGADSTVVAPGSENNISPASDPVDNSARVSPVIGEALPVQELSASSQVADDASSYPAPVESAGADFPEFLSEPRSVEASDSPIMPASFSTIDEAQEIPEAEQSPVEPPEESISFETASPEPPPVEPVQVSSGVEEETAKEHVPLKAESAPAVADPSQESASATLPVETPGHWSTGEVAVQLHRPTAKKKKWEKEAEESTPTPTMSAPVLEALSEQLSEAIREWQTAPEEPAAAPVVEDVPPQPDYKPEWMQASAGITFRQPQETAREEAQQSSSGSISRPQWASTPTNAPVLPESEYASTSAASAVDVLFGRTGPNRYSSTQERPAISRPQPRLVARLHRVRIGLSLFIGSCFSTTRSLTVLALAIATMIVVVALLGVGALAVTWMAMEEPPSALYQRLTAAPPRVMTDMKKNGYFLLMGFDAPAGQDPMQVGYERKPGEHDLSAVQACMDGESASGGNASVGASGHVVKGWFRSADPIGQLKGQGDNIKTLATAEASSLARYKQWVTMPFEDWGYGQSLSPNCGQILLAHRLFVLEGFSQGSALGLDRLEVDTRSWRTALGQSKTLTMKMLAVTALQDDVAMASGLLGGSELDGDSVTRLSKLVRPLDQVELSLRWPMQSQFVLATKSVQAELKQEKDDERSWYASLVAGMRLPVQRRANAYAEYYEEVNKAVAVGRYTNLPKPASFIRTPATSTMDYLANPIEHIVGIEPPPSWDPYVIQMMETDAQVRLVGLQAWLRRGPQEGDLLTRLAKAGQAYYDPFTGLPMLVNRRNGLIYSVGRDGKDQEGDRAGDVAVAIPAVTPSPLDSKRSASASQSR
ncbi:MAG TPA: hypothetical protein VIR79_01185 [Nitrospira sp.]